MYVEVEATRLWFDVDGSGLVPDGSSMRRRPTVVLLHGGPGGFDHSYFKPELARLAEVAHARFDLARMTEGFRGAGGTDVAAIAERSYGARRSSSPRNGRAAGALRPACAV